jgi:hypothetical protein
MKKFPAHAEGKSAAVDAAQTALDIDGRWKVIECVWLLDYHKISFHRFHASPFSFAFIESDEKRHQLTAEVMKSSPNELSNVAVKPLLVLTSD